MCERCRLAVFRRLSFVADFDSVTGYVFSYFSVDFFLLLLIDQGMYCPQLFNFLYCNYTGITLFWLSIKS